MKYSSQLVALKVDDLPLRFKVAECDIESKMLSQGSSLFGSISFLLKRHVPLNPRDYGNGTIFTCGGLNIALIWFEIQYFHNTEGYQVQHGKAALLGFSSLTILNRYLPSYYSMNYSLDLINLQYNLQYIQVNISEESKQVILANVAFPYNGECKIDSRVARKEYKA